MAGFLFLAGCHSFSTAKSFRQLKRFGKLTGSFNNLNALAFKSFVSWQHGHVEEIDLGECSLLDNSDGLFKRRFASSQTHSHQTEAVLFILYQKLFRLPVFCVFLQNPCQERKSLPGIRFENEWRLQKIQDVGFEWLFRFWWYILDQRYFNLVWTVQPLNIRL